MTNGELVARQVRANSEILVIAPTDSGFRVYAPADPRRSYSVSGLPEALECTCPDFQTHTGDPTWRCKHVLAVTERFLAAAGNGADADYDREERRAIQEEGQMPRRRRTQPSAIAQMLLKRSVSPDGRIDALSVEFSVPVGDLAPVDVTARAQAILALQGTIVEQFMGPPKSSRRNGTSPVASKPATAPSPPSPRPADDQRDDLFPARMLAVGGMDGRYGRRLFITVDVNGETSKLFGSRRQLGEALAAAGYAGLAATIAEGASLDLPCRVIAKPSDDGRYLNIQKVLPPETSRHPGGERP